MHCVGNSPDIQGEFHARNPPRPWTEPAIALLYPFTNRPVVCINLAMNPSTDVVFVSIVGLER